MGVYTCSSCGDSTRGDLCFDDLGQCGACNAWVCNSCSNCCASDDCGAPILCDGCAVEHTSRKWACCGLGGEAEKYHPDCVPEAEKEEEHGCVKCGACGKITCPNASECLSCTRAAVRAAEVGQAPLVALDVCTARDALAAARSESLQALLKGWLNTHAGAAGAAGAAKKKRKG